MDEASGSVGLVQSASRGIGIALVDALLEPPEIERVLATSPEAEASGGLGTRRTHDVQRLAFDCIDIGEESSIEAAAKRIAEASPRRS